MFCGDLIGDVIGDLSRQVGEAGESDYFYVQVKRKPHKPNRSSQSASIHRYPVRILSGKNTGCSIERHYMFLYTVFCVVLVSCISVPVSLCYCNMLPLMLLCVKFNVICVSVLGLLAASVCLSVCPSTCLSVCLSVHLSVCVFIFLILSVILTVGDIIS